jgi:hypothetical protein
MVTLLIEFQCFIFNIFPHESEISTLPEKKNRFEINSFKLPSFNEVWQSLPLCSFGTSTLAIMKFCHLVLTKMSGTFATRKIILQKVAKVPDGKSYKVAKVPNGRSSTWQKDQVVKFFKCQKFQVAKSQMAKIQIAK